MDSIIVESEKPSDLSDARIFEFLRKIWIRGHRREDLRVVPADWIQGFPDLMHLLEQAKNRGLIELYPTETEDRGYRIQELTLPPATLEQLENQPRDALRQVTIDGQKVDLRSMVGRMICSASISNIADVCRLWLADLAYESNPKARRKARILLERAIGFRGDELADHDPTLKQQVMDRLTLPVPRRVLSKVSSVEVGSERECERSES